MVGQIGLGGAAEQVLFLIVKRKGQQSFNRTGEHIPHRVQDARRHQFDRDPCIFLRLPFGERGAAIVADKGAVHDIEQKISLRAAAVAATGDIRHKSQLCHRTPFKGGLDHVGIIAAACGGIEGIESQAEQLRLGLSRGAVVDDIAQVGGQRRALNILPQAVETLDQFGFPDPVFIPAPVEQKAGIAKELCGGVGTVGKTPCPLGQCGDHALLRRKEREQTVGLGERHRAGDKPGDFEDHSSSRKPKERRRTSLSRQFSLTLTHRSRNTLTPRNFSRSSLA